MRTPGSVLGANGRASLPASRGHAACHGDFVTAARPEPRPPVVQLGRSLAVPTCLLLVTCLCVPALGQAAPDRRPIGVVTLAAPEYRSRQNPRGWSSDIHGSGQAALVATDGNYAKRFSERLLAHADRCVRWAKLADCQAVLVWDVEGQEFDVPVSHVGDPRVLPPEMTTALALAFFQKFKDAGIHVGGTVRPQTLVQTPYGPRQFRTGDPSVVLTEKVNVARLVYGWRYFYIEANTTADSHADGKPHPLPAEIFVKLAKTFPDCRLIPEFEGEGYRDVATVFPWQTFGDGSPDVPPGRGALAVRPEDGSLAGENRARLVAAFRSGYVPVIPVDRPLSEEWWPKLLEVYRQAGYEPAKKQ